MQAMDTTIPTVGTPKVSFDGLTYDPTNPIPPEPVNPHSKDRDKDTPNIDDITDSIGENTEAIDENTKAIEDLIEGLQELYDELTNIDLSLAETMSEEELATAQAEGDIEILVNDLNSLVNTFNTFLGLFINGRASVEQFQTAMANLDALVKLLNIDLTSLISTQSSLNNVVQTSVLQFMQLALAADTSKNSILDFVSALEDKISTLQASQSANQAEINSLRSIANAARSAAQAYRELAAAKASASDDDSIINAYKTKSYWKDYQSSIFEYEF
jgi:prophage DNA circulation protein